MPDATITRTPKGWPQLDINNYIRVVPEYTQQLAEKLENGDAKVAEAINAATQSEALLSQVKRLIASIPRVAVGKIDGIQRVGYGVTEITFPPGRFTKPPIVTATMAAGGAAGTNRVTLSVSNTTISGAKIHYLPHDTNDQFWQLVNWIAIQTD